MCRADREAVGGGACRLAGGKELGAEFCLRVRCCFFSFGFGFVCFLFVRSWADDAQGGVAPGVLLAGR